MADWDADFEMTDELALQLVTSQFPEFAGQRAKKLGKGWDNVAYCVDGRAVFRFPRRAFAVPFLEQETHWLPRLATRLEMPIPYPRWIGEPTPSFERIFVGYEYLPGTTLCSADVPRAKRAGIAATVGQFCRALHDVDLSEFGAPTPDEIGRRDLDRRMNLIERRVMSLRSRRLLRDGAALTLAQDIHARAKDDGEACWCHGDLYARHVLVEDRRVTGIVDWGDLHFGDRALDLSIAWTAFDFDGRCEFFAAYGDVDDVVRYRAFLKAIHYALTLIDYGHDVSDQALVREGSEALADLLTAEII